MFVHIHDLGNYNLGRLAIKVLINIIHEGKYYYELTLRTTLAKNEGTERVGQMADNQHVQSGGH